MGELQDQLRALRNEMAVRFFGQFTDNAVNTLDAAISELDRLTAEVERLRLDSIHTCHDQCQREACVLRRERDALAAELARLRAKLEVTPENVERVKADIRTHFASDMTASILATAAIKAMGDE